MLTIENCKSVNDISTYIVENTDRPDVGVDIDRVYCTKQTYCFRHWYWSTHTIDVQTDKTQTLVYSYILKIVYTLIMNLVKALVKALIDKNTTVHALIVVKYRGWYWCINTDKDLFW